MSKAIRILQAELLQKRAEIDSQLGALDWMANLPDVFVHNTTLTVLPGSTAYKLICRVQVSEAEVEEATGQLAEDGWCVYGDDYADGLGGRFDYISNRIDGCWRFLAVNFITTEE